jgi:hypothetical protein
VDYQYQIIVRKFHVDYLRGGEGQSRVKRTVGGISEAHGRGHRRNDRGRRRALGPEAATCSGQSGQGRG